MTIGLVLKDLCWWLFKENRLVNGLILSAGRRAFPVRQPVKAAIRISAKSDYLNLRPRTRWYLTGYSSGTTNQPMTVFRSLKSVWLEEYVIKTALARFNVPLRPRIAVLRGDHICAADRTEPPFWCRLPFSGRLIMSSYHISPDTALNYLDKLRQFRPHVIMAYPSSISLLANVAKDANWRASWPLHCVLTSSETFSHEQQELVASVFGPVCDHYGQAERVAVLQSCAYGHYHVRDDYSDVEFVEDEFGTKIVASNRYNKAMPMHRYDTGDYVEGVSQAADCPCGNPSVYVKRILGRDDDHVILPDGRRIGRLDVAFKGIRGLYGAQLEQTSLTQLVLRYISHTDAKIQELEATMVKNLRMRLGSAISIRCLQVQHLPVTSRGKFRSVIRSKALG